MRRHSTIRPFIAVVLLVFTSACLEPYAPEVIRVDLGILVVDGTFVPNDTTTIKLSRTATIDNAINSVHEGPANVMVESDKGVTYILSQSKSGDYRLPPVNADITAKYRVRIHAADGLDYNSEFVPLNTSQLIDSVSWTEEQNETEDVVGFDIYSHDPSGATRYYMWTYAETWEYNAIDVSIYKYENGNVLPRQYADELFFCWRTINQDNYSLGSSASLSEDIIYRYRLNQLPQNSRKLAIGYSVLVKQYGLTVEGFGHWTAIKKNSESLGTLFDPVPSQPNSNISCASDPSQPAVGFFSASYVRQYRVFLKRQQLKGSPLPYTPSGYELCDKETLSLDQINDTYMDTRIINDQIFDPVTQKPTGYIVYPKECLDCREKGGTTIKPDYWK